MSRRILILVFALSLAIFSDLRGGTATGSDGTYEPPRQLDDGWPVSTPEAEGLNTGRLITVNERIDSGKYRGIHSVVVVKNGALVHEAYFGGYSGDQLHTIFSITKSVSSALVGIAIEEGYIKDVDQYLPTLLPEYADDIRDARVGNIQLKHILTLTSGLEWDETSAPYNNPGNSEYHQVRSVDWVRYVVERPLRDEPGTRYVYNTGSVHLLSAIIKSTTGLYANEFAEKYLFNPLGIERYEWNTDPKGYQCTGGTHGGLQLKPRDVAKFGLLFLREGRWNDKQVLSKEWIEQSTAKRVRAFGSVDFGYLWWSGTFRIRDKSIDYIYGAGYGGQSLHLVPELDMVIVFTCWARAEDADIFAPLMMIYNAALEGNNE